MARAVLVLLLILASRAGAEVVGDLGLLKQVAELQQQNLAAIRQWTGRAELEFHASKSADDYDFTQTVDATFAQDRASNSICFSWVVTDSFARKRGHDDLVDSLKGFRAGALLVGDDYYKMSLPMGRSLPDPSAITVTLGGWSEPNIGGVSQMFYPMSYFRIWNDESAEFFDSKFKNVDAEWMHMEIQRNGQRVRLDLVRPGYEQYKQHYIFDLSKSGLLVEFNGADPYLGESQHQEYQEFSGVFLPVHTVFRNASLDGSEVDEKEVHWKDQILNEPIPASAFTLEAMGVPEGASVIDFRTRESYRYAPEGESPAPESSETQATPAPTVTPPATPTEQGNRWWLWLLLPAALGGALLTWWFRRANVSK